MLGILILGSVAFVGLTLGIYSYATIKDFMSKRESKHKPSFRVMFKDGGIVRSGTVVNSHFRGTESVVIIKGEDGNNYACYSSDIVTFDGKRVTADIL